MTSALFYLPNLLQFVTIAMVKQGSPKSTWAENLGDPGDPKYT